MQTLSLMFFSTLLCGGRLTPLHEEHCVAYYEQRPFALLCGSARDYWILLRPDAVSLRIPQGFFLNYRRYTLTKPLDFQRRAGSSIL